jgi:hypothetical protein
VLNALQVIQKKTVLEEHSGRGHTRGPQIDRALLKKWEEKYHVQLQFKLKQVLDVPT